MKDLLMSACDADDYQWDELSIEDNYHQPEMKGKEMYLVVSEYMKTPSLEDFSYCDSSSGIALNEEQAKQLVTYIHEFYNW